MRYGSINMYPHGGMGKHPALIGDDSSLRMSESSNPSVGIMEV